MSLNIANNMLKEIILPHNYQPRTYQLPVLQALDSGIKRAVCVWHRRAGKDKTFLNYAIRCMYERVGIYYYFFPTYSQGKKILWDGIDKEGFSLLDHFPEPLITSKNATEMKITLVNGSLFQVVGTDNYDSIVGTNPVGCIFSEFALQDPAAWGYIRPILAENGGWAIFPYTPRGFNHGFDLFQMASINPKWYCERLTIDNTHVLSSENVDEERHSGMSEPLIQQEFYCSFEHAAGMAFRDIDPRIHKIDVSNPPERLWNIFDFDKMRPLQDIQVYRSYDWGFAKPFSIGYWFTDYEGRLYRWAEIYGCRGVNEGLQMPTREQAQKMKQFEADKGIKPIICVAGADIWSHPSNMQERSERLPSDAEIAESEGIYFDHDVSKDASKAGSRHAGKGQMHDRLRVDADGLPSIFIFSTCVDWWRTVPNLPTDKLSPDKIDTEAEDHAWDETYKMLLARPFKSHISKPELKPYSLTWFLKKQEERQNAYR